MAILVTGAAGFIGFHCCRALLDAGHDIVGVHHSSNGLAKFAPYRANSRLRLVEADVRDTAAIEGLFAEVPVETVYHLVGYLPTKEDLALPTASFTTNAVGTLNLLQSSRRHSVRRFVYASSIDVYSEPPQRLPVDETHPTMPSSIYGAGKMSGELLCGAYARTFEVVSLRYSVVYGTGVHPQRAVPTFVRQSLAAEQITIFGGGLQANDFVYVGDVTKAHLLALKGPPGTYNIGSGESVTVRELANRISRLCNVTRDPVVTGEPTNKPFTFALDIAKARRELHYAPRSLDEGLAAYLQEIRRSGEPTIDPRRSVNPKSGNLKPRPGT